MRLFTPNEIQAVKAKERKLEIDQGMALAKRVDKLREALTTEEANLQKFRSETVPLVQRELANVLEQVQGAKDELLMLQKECREARKPLDHEWELLHIQERELESNQYAVLVQQRNLSDWENELVDQSNGIERDQASLEQEKEQVRQAQKEVRALHSQKEGELAIAQTMRAELAEEYRQKLIIVAEKERTLEYDIKHNEDFKSELNKRDHELSQKEVRLNIRDNAKRKN